MRSSPSFATVQPSIPSLICLALGAWGVVGCGASPAHHETMRQLENTKIELVQVESRVILSEEQARTLRARIQALQTQKQTLTAKNKILANKTLTSSQASDLQTQNKIQAARQTLELGLRSPLLPHLQKKTVDLTFTQGHPRLTLQVEDLFAPNNVTASPSHSSLLADLARAIGATKGGHVIMHCRTFSPKGARLCARRLDVLATRVREFDPTVTLYPHTSQQPSAPLISTPGKDSSKDSPKAQAKDSITKAPDKASKRQATLEIVVLVDLSALAGS